MRRVNKHAKTAGFGYFNWNYGWILAKTLKNTAIVDRIVDFVDFYQHLTKQGIILYGHSNGCELAWRVAKRTRAVIGLVLHNAALDADVEFPERLQFIHNWYTPTDTAVGLAAWIPFNTWGDLGSREYSGFTSGVKNFDKSRFPMASKEHSDTFRDPMVANSILPATFMEIHKELEEK